MAESESSWSIPLSLELNADYVHPVGRVALLSPGAALGSSDPMAACRTQPPWRGWGQRWDWVSLATPGPVCLTSLACFSGVISAQWGPLPKILAGFVCLVPWRAQQHWGAACGLGRMFHSSECRTRCASSQKRMSELASGASLLGMDNCSPGQVLDNLPIFLLNVPGWFSHKSVFLTPCSAHRQHTREKTGCWREAERGARGNEGLSYKTSQK